MAYATSKNTLRYVRVTSEPAAEPVSTADMKAWLKVGNTADDDLIDDLVKAVRQEVELYLNRSLITQTRVAHFDQFSTFVDIPYGPIQSISQVKRIDPDESETTLTENIDFYIKSSRDVRLYFPEGTNLGFEYVPITGETIYGLQVQYIAGYGMATAIPDAIIKTIKKLVAYDYADRMGELSMESNRSRLFNEIHPYKNLIKL